MKKTVFHLNTCATNRKIIQSLPLEGWTFRETKKDPITEEELAELRRLAGSYEALFSHRSTQIRQRGIDVKNLTEQDYHDLLLDHYSFLQRPVFVDQDRIFIGNAPDTLAALQQYVAE